MILSTCSPSHVGSAIAAAAAQLDEPVKNVALGEADLFSHALGCRTLVYAPEARLLDAELAQPDPARMRRIVSAAHAPGVERVVVIVPAQNGDAWEEEHRVLRKDGIGYTIVRAHPLVDELADAANLHTARSVWLPRGTQVRLASTATLTATLHDVLRRDDTWGATIDVPSETMDVGEALRRAGELAGAAIRVHVTSPSMSFAMRKLSSWMGFVPPELERLCDRLAARPQAA